MNMFNKYCKQQQQIVIFVRLVKKNYWIFSFFFAFQVGMPP